jgi:hypothetical protein
LFRISDLGFRIFKFALPLFILVFGFWISSYAQEWQELKGEHFLVYFTQDKKFAQEVLDKAEVYYQRIASDLGYPRYSEFWLWDKRVKIYIYPDHASFLAATGQPQWSQGMADYKNKQIISFLWSKGFLESLLPHEMAHLIFRDFVGFKGEIPLWLDEGVAQWAEEAKRGEMKFKVQQLFEKDALLSLEDMIRLDIRNVTEKDRVYIRSTRTKEGDKGIVFLSGDNLITTYYLQSVSLVGFLIEKYGSERFADFCRQLRDGKTIEEALKFAYPVYMRNLKELENRWREYLSEN